MSAPFLILQARPETDVADDEFAAILAKGGLNAAGVVRVRLEREPVPLPLDQVAGIIVGGGPGCVSDPPQAKSAAEARIEAAALALMPQIVDQDIPFLGCCYGLGVLAHHLGGAVAQERFSEPVGVAACHVVTRDPVLVDIPDDFQAFVGHKEAVQALPPGCVHLVGAPDCPIQMIRHGRNVYATQFHPEADADGFALRIAAYRDKGYFDPDAADDLIAMCRAADVQSAGRIIGNFVNRYRR